MQRAYEIISSQPQMNRLNLEVEFDPQTDDPQEARRREYDAVVKSIRFVREVLKV